MFKVEINTGNAAFGEDYFETTAELKRILEKIIEDLDLRVVEKAPIIDINGNKVGYWELTKE